MLENKLLYDVGDLCRQSRERKHFSQNRVAVVLEKNQSNISRFEIGAIDSISTLAWYVAKCYTDKDLTDFRQICLEYINAKMC